MPNQLKLDKILNDVRRKVVKHAYVPKTVRKKYAVEVRDEDSTLLLKPKK